MSANYSQITPENHSYHQQDVPQCLLSNNSAQSIKSRNRIIQLSSTSSTQSSGGLILFNIPPSNYSITKGSVLLRCRVTVTGTTLGTTAANAVSFQGFGNIAAAAPFVTEFGNAYAIFNRMTLFASNSSIIEQVNYLNDNENLMLMHNSNPTFLKADGALMLGIGKAFAYSPAADVGTSATIDLAIPLPLSFFNSTTQNVPLYLMSSPLTLQLDLATVARSLFRGASAVVTDYSVSNAFLMYQAVELPNAFVEAQRMSVKSSPYIMNLTNSMSVQVPMSVLNNYTLGVNASSVRAVFLLPLDGTGYVITTSNSYAKNVADGNTASLFIDGNIVNSAIFDNSPVLFSQLKQAMHHSLQTGVLFPSVCTAVTYDTEFFAIGFDCTNFDEEATIFAGTPATQLSIQLNNYTSDAKLVTIIVLYDTLVAIEADGSVSTKR
jgi:hypothetical protein